MHDELKELLILIHTNNVTIFLLCVNRYNRTHFSEWAKSVLNEVKMRKMEEATKVTTNQIHECSCI